MNNKCSDDIQKPDCCDQEDCCPPSSRNKTPETTGGRRWWKTAVFAVVMLIVAGMIAYSILAPETDATNIPISEVSAASTTPSLPDNSPATPSSGELTSLYNLDVIFADHDFIFVILPASDSESTTEAARLVAEAEAKIQAQDVRVGIFTLSQDNPEFATTADRWSIFQFPAVLALYKDGSGQLVAYDITETKLLQAYLGACGGTSSSCCPPSGGNSNSCCP